MMKGINDAKKNKLMGSCETSEHMEVHAFFSLSPSPF